MQNQNELSEPAYFAKQETIYPKRARGRFRNLKWLAMVVTLTIYYLVPFIRWDRGENAPNQAVLIDMVNAKAYWFFIEIWPQEIYIFTGILILAAVALFFVTSLFGRVWCGYFCPQTVWTDLFIWVEHLIQGDRNARKKLREGKLTFEKIYKVGFTHLIWLAISWCTAGSFVLYFNDAPTLVRSFFEFNVSSTVLAFIGGLTFSTYLMAGYAREQVCTYMCPYARFQSAMFDSNTLIIGYDQKRGELRGSHKKGDVWGETGHCIDCTACVQVCPMGIDIRNGLQMECIACGLCIDACDDIMTKIGLPTGLVRYDTDKKLNQTEYGKGAQVKLIRPRTIYYSIIMVLVGAVMIYALATRKILELHVLHNRNPVFVQLSNGEISNRYDIKILNKTHENRSYTLTVTGLTDAEINVKATENISPQNLIVAAGEVAKYHILVKSNIEPDAARRITFTLTDNVSGTTDTHTSIFITQKGSEDDE